MPDISTIFLFALASLALTASPGPDMMLVAARSAAQGRLAGLATYLGVAVGSLCHALAMALGLSQLFLAVPLAYDFVRYAGAAYLLFLAWQALMARHVACEVGAQRRRTMAVMFRQGFLSNILNPKVALFFLALFPQFVNPEAGSVAVQILVLALVLNVVGFFVNGAVILAASRARAFLSGNGGFRRISNYLLATVFAGLAARLALDGQR